MENFLSRQWIIWIYDFWRRSKRRAQIILFILLLIHLFFWTYMLAMAYRCVYFLLLLLIVGSHCKSTVCPSSLDPFYVSSNLYYIKLSRLFGHTVFLTCIWNQGKYRNLSLSEPYLFIRRIRIKRCTARGVSILLLPLRCLQWRQALSRYSAKDRQLQIVHKSV